MANVPWAPAETVYLHQREPVADANDNADDQDPETSADFDEASDRAPSRLRRSIPLLWAAALTIAALQHAGEVERRAALQEPTPAQVEMQNRSEQEIRGAWRKLGMVMAVTEERPVQPIAAEDKAEPVVAHRQVEPAEARPIERKPLDLERLLVEPVTAAVHKTTSEGAESPVKSTAEQSAREDIAAATTTKASEVQAKAEAESTLPPVVEEVEPAKPIRKGRVIVSEAPQQKIARAAEPKNARPTRAKSTKYVEFDGQGPRYFTIERPSRGSP
ncbi:MAG: hypothetical protein ACKVP3_19470 [Hyphomicrobiaceae bacterium]